MNLIEHTTQWVKGEVLQGRIGFSLSILALICFLYFVNLQETFYKGIVLPFSLLLLVIMGYSSFQMIMRPKHIEKVQQELIINPEKAVQTELIKVQKDDAFFSKLKMVWAVLFVVSGILFFSLNNEFWKGVSLGFVGLFLVAYIFDSFLHHRLQTYLFALQKLT